VVAEVAEAEVSSAETTVIEPEPTEAVVAEVAEPEPAIPEPAATEPVVAEVAEAGVASAEPVVDAQATSGGGAEAVTGQSVEASANAGTGANANDEAADAFASLSEELLAGLDEVAALEHCVAALNKPAPATEDAFASLTDELLSGLGEVPPPPEPEAVVVPEVSPAPPPPRSPSASPAEAEAKPTESPHTTTAARRVLHAAGHAGMSAAHKLEPHALRAAAAISSPLNSKAPSLRDTIGWLGVYTLFVGLTLAVYVRFLHQTPSPTPAHPGVKLAEKNDHKGAGGEVVRTEEQGSAAHGEEHGAAEAGGHGAAKEDAHGAKKDDGHGAKKDDGHGGGAKGGGKAITAPKLPTPAIKPGPEKPGAKKDAKKKDDGHGGGH
jgi:hypothetical protein